MKRLFAAAVLAVAVLPGGCAAPQAQSLRAGAVGGVVASVPGVPFYPQARHQCGPASLAALLEHAGRPVSPRALEPELYVPDREGALTVEMVAAARRHGALAYPLPPRLDALVDAVAHGLPVLTLQNDGLSWLPRWHYAVVTGVDVSRGLLWQNSGRTEHMVLGLSTFERVWVRGGSWALLVLPVDDYPSTLAPRTVLAELAELERAGSLRDAQAGFARAVRFWPEQEVAWLGLADTSLALGDAARAEAVLRELAERAPTYAPGLNNLADLLLRAGRAGEALPFAERAVAALDIPATRDTLAAARAAVAGTAGGVSPGVPPTPGSR